MTTYKLTQPPIIKPKLEKIHGPNMAQISNFKFDKVDRVVKGKFIAGNQPSVAIKNQ